MGQWVPGWAPHASVPSWAPPVPVGVLEGTCPGTNLCALGPHTTSQTLASPTRLSTGLGNRPPSSAGRPPRPSSSSAYLGFWGRRSVSRPLQMQWGLGWPHGFLCPHPAQVLRAAPVGV